MILKSMSVECNKTDMDNYAGDVDEEESGKFTFVQFCSVSFWGLLSKVTWMYPGKKAQNYPSQTKFL